MADETLSATTVINAPAETIFAVLADPSRHPAIDGTGWVHGYLGDQPITAAGQVFQMDMRFPNNLTQDYQMSNEVQVFDAPQAISWKPGQPDGDGVLRFGGWIWRYDLAPAGPGQTTVTLSYDWSAVPDVVREQIQFPPFPPDHLANSLAHLSSLATA